MKYESDILKTIHENALENFKLGIITKERMREYDEMCLESEILQDNNTHKTANMEHTNFITV